MTPDDLVIPDVVVTVELSENPQVLTPQLSTIPEDKKQLIASMVQRAQEAKRVNDERQHQFDKIQRQLDDVIIALLEAPNGLTSGEILGLTEMEDTATVLRHLRARLKKDGKYTLKRRKQKHYFMDPIR